MFLLASQPTITLLQSIATTWLIDSAEMPPAKMNSSVPRPAAILSAKYRQKAAVALQAGARFSGRRTYGQFERRFHEAGRSCVIPFLQMVSYLPDAHRLNRKCQDKRWEWK
jgi:hypothetical protein